MEPCSMITFALLFMVVVVGGCCWLVRYVYYDAHRYEIDSKKAFRRFSYKLSKAMNVTKDKQSDPEELIRLRHFLYLVLVLVEEIACKIPDETSRIRFENTFMVVEGTQPDTPIRVCVGNLVINLTANNHDHHAAGQAFEELIKALRKISEG